MVQSPVFAETAPPRSAAADRVGSSAIRDLLRLTERAEVISLAGGLPDPTTFPSAEIAAAAARVLAHDPAAALQYSVTEGYGPLRAWIATRCGAAAPDGIDSVLVTHGSQQALDLVLRAFVEPGEAVAVADPCYVGALQLLRLGRADIVGIESDADGLRTDLLADRLGAGLRPRLVYVVANFHNPTGATLSLARRIELAALADRYGFVIVDDDPYGELRWGGEPLTRLAALSDRVVTLGSFSKILSPGLRLGYATAPSSIIDDLVILKQAADLHTSSLTQRVVFDVVDRPEFLDHHLAAIRARYASRAATLADALHHHVGDRLSFAAPDGGMFLWADGDDSIDATALLGPALDAGVAFVPGPAFAAASASPRAGSAARHRSSLRLSFATATPADLDEAARRLASILPD